MIDLAKAKRRWTKKNYMWYIWRFYARFSQLGWDAMMPISNAYGLYYVGAGSEHPPRRYPSRTWRGPRGRCGGVKVWRLEAPFKPPSCPLQASFKPPSCPLQAPLKPPSPWSPLEAPLKPPWSPLKPPLKPPWSPLQAPFVPPLQAPFKPPSSPLRAPFKPPSCPLQAPSKPPSPWSPLEAPLKLLEASWSPLEAPLKVPTLKPPSSPPTR